LIVATIPNQTTTVGSSQLPENELVNQENSLQPTWKVASGDFSIPWRTSFLALVIFPKVTLDSSSIEELKNPEKKSSKTIGHV
jgi:hypothetical protein